MSGFGEIRSLLQQPPSEAVYEQLCALLERANPQEALEVLLPYARAHMDRAWPNALRPWLKAWTRRFIKGMALPMAGLAKRCDLHNRNLTQHNIAPLFVHDYADQFDELNLGGNNLLGESLALVAKLPSLRGVRHLDLSEVGLCTPAQIEQLFCDDALEKLRALTLGYDGELHRQLPLIAQTPVGGQLEQLQLNMTILSAEQRQDFLRAELTNLRDLSWYIHNLQPQDLAALSSSPWWQNLERLRILYGESVEFMARMWQDRPTGLRVLELPRHHAEEVIQPLLAEQGIEALDRLICMTREPRTQEALFARLKPSATRALIKHWFDVYRFRPVAATAWLEAHPIEET